MKRLRHPIRAIREPFGTAGLIVACLALVLAMGGAAVAAKGGLTKSQEKQVTKIAKKFAGKHGKHGKRGKRGPAGPAGPQGTVGPAGPKGNAGQAGTNGQPGRNGVPGQDGKSVVLGTATSGECEEGGATVEVEGNAATKHAICNGSPWTAGGTLPPGATEMGTWALNGEEADGNAVAAISFGLPLPNLLEPSHAVYVTASTNPDPTHCNGNVREPKAASGYLCVYETAAENLTFVGVLGAEAGSEVTPSGAILLYEPTADGAFAFGSWAVTG